MIKIRKKLIEVAIPLDSINSASAKEKSIRHGHPSTLHLWWSRKPLGASRAIIFCQMVDDPSAITEKFTDVKSQEIERLRLFQIVEDLAKWENTSNKEILSTAFDEIKKSWERCCDDNKTHPEADLLFNKKILPEFHDPFSGGGSIPIAAQYLKLKSYASDLNPVAVALNKAMIELPVKFVNHPPINPSSKSQKSLISGKYLGAAGLAEDISYYGDWICNEAFKKIGNLYPKIRISEKTVALRRDLEPYLGQEFTVIAWMFARTIKSPDPAFSNVKVPLASTFMLSTKKGREAYLVPEKLGQDYRFKVKVGLPDNLEEVKKGTKSARGPNFTCLMSGAAINGSYIKEESKEGRLGNVMMAIIADGPKGRIYLEPCNEHEFFLNDIKPVWRPSCEMSGSTQYLGVKPYGITEFDQLFTNRQLLALNTFSDLLNDVQKVANFDALGSGMINDGKKLKDGGRGAFAYSEVIKTYLSLVVDKCSDYWSSICTWHNSKELMRNTFGRQAIPMSWEYVEANPFSNSSGNWTAMKNWTSKALAKAPCFEEGIACQSDATTQKISQNKIISTDPPYFDNIPYADISDFFYVWMRKNLKDIFPELFATITVPKKEELISAPHRQGGKEKAKNFFLCGMTDALKNLSRQSNYAYPITIYYAFKQIESTDKQGRASTGWETFLEAILNAGLAITGTWPMRTELTMRMMSQKNNALASSVVLVCKKKDMESTIISKNDFKKALRKELPLNIDALESSNIAPVDLAQAAIGPGMAIFSQAKSVLNPDDSKMSVRDALVEINIALDEYLSENEDELDIDSRFALTFFQNFGYSIQEFGTAENLAKARNVSVQGIVNAGILKASSGKVQLIKRDEFKSDWDPTKDDRIGAWEATQHLIKRLETSGEYAASQLLNQIKKINFPQNLDSKCQSLAYLLYNHCEKTNQFEEARSYNSLIISWPEIEKIAAGKEIKTTIQTKLI